MWRVLFKLISANTPPFMFAHCFMCVSIAGCLVLSVHVNAGSSNGAALSQLTQQQPGISNSEHRSTPENQVSLATLTNLAAEQVRADKTFLGKTRFSIDRQNRTFFLDSSPTPSDFVLSSGDPYGVPLEALIRTEALRRDFHVAIPGEKLWAAQLDSIQEAVEQCIRIVSAAPPKDLSAIQQECSKGIAKQFDGLKKSVDSYATAEGLKQVVPPQTRGELGYPVRVAIVPPKARIRVMTLLEFKKYQYLNTPKGEYQWIDLIGSQNIMIGMYHYVAEWPPELNGPEEGNFEIRGPQTITFTPPQK